VVVDEMSSFVCETALTEGFAKKGDTIVVAARTPIGISVTTNMLKIPRV
jgi:pyruvate kinase